MLAVAVLLLAAVPAFAAKIYITGPSFGWHVNMTAIAEGRLSEENVCPAPGHLADRCQPGEPGSNPGQLSEPTGIAVNDSTNSLLEPAAGDVYVVDRGNNRVERFGPGGEYKGQFNGTGEFEVEGNIEHGSLAPTGEFSGPELLAVDDDQGSPSFGDVYVSYKGNDTFSIDRGGDKAIDKFGPTGAYLGQIDEVGCPEVAKHQSQGEQEVEELVCPPGSSVPFNDKILGMSADPFGDLWVDYELSYVSSKVNSSYQYLAEFSPTGTFMTASTVGYNGAGGLAHDSVGNLYRLSPGNGVDSTIQKYDASTLELVCRTRFSTGGVNPSALVINPVTGGPLVASAGTIELYEPIAGSCPSGLGVEPPKLGLVEPLPSPGLGVTGGMGVNATGTVYAGESDSDRVQIYNYVPVPTVATEAPSEVTENGLTLRGSVTPEGEAVGKCDFQFGTEAGHFPEEVPCEQRPAQIGAGNEPVEVTAKLTGLPPASLRSFRLTALSGAGVPANGRALTISRPLATGEAASEVGSSTAKVGATINAGNLPTCYWFEYGTATPYPASTPQRCLGAGETERASAELSGLKPETEYSFRLVARNALGERPAGVGAFTTFPPSSAQLPDGRLIEAVSAIGVSQNTEVYVPFGMEGVLDSIDRHGISTNLPFRAAAGGEAVTYIGDPPPSGGNGNEGVGGGNQYLAHRLPRGGWAQTSISPSGYGNEYRAFSGDLSVGVLGASEQLSPAAPPDYSNLYSRSLSWRPAPEASLEPLLGPFEPSFDTNPCVPPSEFGALLDNAPTQRLLFAGGNAGTGAAAPFTHLLFEANAALPATPSPQGCRAGNDLYDWIGGQLQLVNVLPDGRVEPSATFGRQGPSKNGFASPEISGAISADGSRVFWSAVEPVPVGGEFEERAKALYVRLNDTQPQSPLEEGECTVPTDACTLRLDTKQEGAPGPSGSGQFQTASADGTRVLFTDENPLTVGSTAAPGEPDLYQYDFSASEGQRLTDLSADPEPGQHADAQGLLGASEDGSYVYFVADGVLTGAEENQAGEHAEAGRPNLYLHHAGATIFIAALAPEDGDFTRGEGGHDGDWQADPGHRTGEVSPDGHSVVFMSRRPLTGYENKVDGIPLTEVFVYDADTGHLACASCNPSGEAPGAPTLPEYAREIAKVWGSFFPVSDSLAAYQPRLITDHGDRVFFDSIEPLVPSDENGLLDVYEWEREGAGGCARGSTLNGGGCIYLLSGGQSADNSYLIDASESGNDVFFVSRARLVRADRGDNDVLYDARVGGVQPPEPPSCTGTGCQGVPPSPPIFAAPPTASFQGTGNFPPPTPCPRGRVRRHGSCLKPAKHPGKRHRRHRRAHRHRGGGS